MKPVESFDRRGFGRRQTNINAQVRIGYRVVPCIIKDLSEGGALIEFADPIDLPQKLWLSWPEQKSEIICEVRHSRRNMAGVQFSRPQTLSLRAALAPSDPVAIQPATAAKTGERTHSAFDLVAERRRATRHAGAAVSATPGAKETPAQPVQTPEPPRDLSTLMQSLKAAAQSIVEARSAASVPRPLAGCNFAGAAVTPPSIAPSNSGPRPLPASHYAVAVECSGALGRARSLRSIASTLRAAREAARVPRPLPAAAYAEASAPTPEASSQVPMPLPAYALTAFAERGLEATQQPCDGHPCALAVWRNLANPAPRPLPASAYGKHAGSSVA